MSKKKKPKYEFKQYELSRSQREMTFVWNPKVNLKRNQVKIFKNGFKFRLGSTRWITCQETDDPGFDYIVTFERENGGEIQTKRALFSKEAIEGIIHCYGKMKDEKSKK